MKKVNCGIAKPMRIEMLDEVLDGIEVPETGDILLILDDHTRPNVSVIPLAISAILKKIDYNYSRLSILFATGMHRNMTQQEVNRKITSRYATLIKTYQHNPFVEYTPWLTHLNDYYRISLSCVMPHSYMGFSGGAKIIVPGLLNIKQAIQMHGDRCRADELIDLAYNGRYIDQTIQVVVDWIGTVASVNVGQLTKFTHSIAVEKCREVNTVKLPKSVDTAVLQPSFKNTDFLQSINALTVLQGYNCVREGGTIAIQCDCVDGIGIHHLFNKGGPLHGYIDEGTTFGPLLEHRSLAFITESANKDLMQEYFKMPIGVFRRYDDFDLTTNDTENAVLIEGADCSIGQKEDEIVDI